MEVDNDKLRKELEHLPKSSELIKKIEPLLNTPSFKTIFISIKYKQLWYAKKMVIVVFECQKSKKWKTVNYLLLDSASESWHQNQEKLEDPALALASIVYSAYESPSDGFINIPL